MARKSYSEQDRERVRRALLDTGAAIIRERGFQGLHLAELTVAVGISKPYFYTFFDSLEELCLNVVEDQRQKLTVLLEQALDSREGSWEEKLERFLYSCLHHRENGLLIMTQQEEAAIHSRLTPERLQSFRAGQRAFFRRLLELMGISPQDCPPEVLANLVLSCLVVYNSAPESMPFLFPEYLEEAAAVQARSTVAYLSSLRKKGR